MPLESDDAAPDRSSGGSCVPVHRAWRDLRIEGEWVSSLSYHRLLVFLVPFVVRDQEVKSPSSGSPQGLAEGLKLLIGVQMLASKEDVDGLGFRR